MLFCCLDEISEMYGKLRRLVLEYLGIPPTPNKHLSGVQPTSYPLDDCTVGLPYTERRGQSAPLPTRRSWSRPSITDISEVTRSNIPAAVQTKSPPAARGTVAVSYTHLTLPTKRIV